MKFLVLLLSLVTGTAFAAGNPAGEKAFATNCASCHGTDGKAQTDIGKALKARNLVVDEFKQVKDKKKGVTEADLMGTLKTGVPGTGMASFAHLPEADRKAIAKYVVELRKSAKK
jgi:high-affinity iron transporter